MNIENGILCLDANISNLEIESIVAFIKENIIQIKEVIVDEKSMVASSCLFALLKSIKNTKGDISIKLLDNDNDIESFGNVTFLRYK